MNYPSIRIEGNSLKQQAQKIKEEAQEIIDALESGEPIERIIEETCDTEHATETLIRMLVRDCGGMLVTAGRDFVIKKNIERGYYEEDTLSK